MKAIVYTEYGPPEVLRLAEVAKPVPRDDEVLVRVRAASLNPLDWHYLRGTPLVMRMVSGWRKPKVAGLGVDHSGEVEAVGRNVAELRPGDEVFGAARGAFAEYVCVSKEALVPKPANLTFAQAAAVPVAAVSALQALRDQGRIQPGQKVLINGASGGVGTFAVQIAGVLGTEVTGVCSTRNVDLVQSLGARQVIDYTRDDFARNGQRYDLILDMVGNRSLAECRRALTPRGNLVLVGGPNEGRWLGALAGVLKAAVVSRFVSQNFRPFLAHVSKADLRSVREWIEAGKVVPVIDRSYPLREVPAAIRYLEEGHARGKVVVTMDETAT